MKIARARTADGQVHLCTITGELATPVLAEGSGPGSDALVEALASGTDLARAAPAGPPVPLGEVQLLAPVRAPQKILAVGLNYADHAAESQTEVPDHPVVFVKTPNSLAGPGEAICYRYADSEQVDYEAELAVVVGRRLSRAGVAEALDGVAGYTAANDVSARDAQFADGQWTRGKSFDTFCPVGPWVVTADEVGDPQALSIACRVNGVTLQDAGTSDMIFGVGQILSYLSQTVTLLPGDLVLTGTPPGVGFARKPPVYLRDGDTVEVEVERIGVLANPVKAS